MNMYNTDRANYYGVLHGTIGNIYLSDKHGYILISVNANNKIYGVELKLYELVNDEMLPINFIISKSNMVPQTTDDFNPIYDEMLSETIGYKFTDSEDNTDADIDDIKKMLKFGLAITVYGDLHHEPKNYLDYPNKIMRNVHINDEYYQDGCIIIDDKIITI